MNHSSQRFFSLSEVTNRINAILGPATEKTFWVRAEISGGSQKGGHFYCDLVELDGQAKQIAKIRCTIWRTQFKEIKAKFEKSGLEFELGNGTVVGFSCKVAFSPVYGLSLNVMDADPTFSIGVLELRRRELLLTLQTANLFELNKRLSVPLIPKRIGLITSENSAACADFLKTLDSAEHGFRVLLADSRMQGVKTEQSVCYAFDVVTRLKPDLIVIIRGGGSKADLSHLDNELIARRIANSEIPVWTGVGHEIDESVLDFVSNRSFKTPTAVAVAIVEKFDRVQMKTTEAAGRIRNTWKNRLVSDQRSLTRWQNGLMQGTRKVLEFSNASLKNKISGLRLSVERQTHRKREYCLTAKSKLKNEAKSRISKRRSQRSQLVYALSSASDSLVRLKEQYWLNLQSRFQIDRFLDLVSYQSKELSGTRERLWAASINRLKSDDFKLVSVKSQFRSSVERQTHQKQEYCSAAKVKLKNESKNRLIARNIHNSQLTYALSSASDNLLRLKQLYWLNLQSRFQLERFLEIASYQARLLMKSSERLSGTFSSRLKISDQNLLGLRSRFRVRRYLEKLDACQTHKGVAEKQLKSFAARSIDLRRQKLNSNFSSFRLERFLLKIQHEARDLQGMHRSIKLADPKSILSKGYSLTFGNDGELVTSSVQVSVNDYLLVKFKDGAVKTKVKEVMQDD